MLPDVEKPKSSDASPKESVSTSHHFSEPAATNLALQHAFSGKDDLLASIPSIPAVLQSLLNELDRPADLVNLLRVAEIIGRDETLAAQCLRMANSPLFSRSPGCATLRGAVRTLGIARVREVAVSCGMMRVFSYSKVALNPLVLWQHSLASAIVARKLARSVGFGDPDKAYLAGLMHDIGYIVNLVVLPQQTQAVLEKALHNGIFAGEVEYRELGFTHCQSGEILGRQWRLSDGLVEVILCHHDPHVASINPALVGIVALSDRLCRASNLGLGYAETASPLESCESIWQLLSKECPFAADLTWSDFMKESANYLDDIHSLVESIYELR